METRPLGVWLQFMGPIARLLGPIPLSYISVICRHSDGSILLILCEPITLSLIRSVLKDNVDSTLKRFVFNNFLRAKGNCMCCHLVANQLFLYMF